MKSKIIVFYFQLGQDLDVLLPALDHLRGIGHEIRVLTKNGLFQNSRRTESLLRLGVEVRELKAKPHFLDICTSLKGAQVVITASESSVGPHREAHRIVRLANLLRKITITLQHGFENIGLTYFDKEYPENSIRFASQMILTWSEELHPLIPSATKKKCIPAGFPKTLQSSYQLPNPYRDFLAIFENLHWSRYSDHFRESFISLLDQLASTFPEKMILVKPHHAGKWLTTRYKGRVVSHSNLFILDPDSNEWEPFTAPAIIANALKVISTPSSVCVDASLAEKPIAVLNFDDQVHGYDFASNCRSIEDVITFVRQETSLSQPTSSILSHENFLRTLERIITL